MKNLFSISLTVFLTLFSFSAFATTYYLSSSSGSDNNSGTDPSSPWRTINKLNSFYNLRPGDNVLFKRGDTFYGGIVVNNSGSSGSPITYGAYGSGAKPVVTGFTNITSWTNLGGNIWESSDVVSSLSYLNIVVINNNNTPMGRFPNSDFFTYQSNSGNTSISSSSLTGSTNWTGAQSVIKKERYVFEKGTITSQSGGTLYYSDPGLYSPTAGFGFFIQNDSRTLDSENEWFFNPLNKKIRIYSISAPSNVQVPSIDQLVSFGNGVGYITIDNILFTGCNSSAINLANQNNITIQNCDITFAGINAIKALNSPYITLTNNQISETNNNGIQLDGNCTNPNIAYNTIRNIGLFEGMTQSYSSCSISCMASNSVIQYNTIVNSGYIGIDLRGSNIQVNNNFINNSCIIKDDGGGIYLSLAGSNRTISNNIIINSIGTASGTNDATNILAHGIFLENLTTNVTVSGNSISGCNGSGIFLHNANSIIVTGNTSYNNGIANNFLRGSFMIQYDPTTPSRNLQINNNLFVAKTTDQYAMYCYTPSADDLKLVGTFNNNCYSKPIDDNSAILAQGNGIPYPGNYYNATTWKAYIGQDATAFGSPMTITNSDNLRFEYNATTSSKTVSLGALYIDLKGNSYNGTITLEPFTSAVLIKKGLSTLQQEVSWTASAGPDQTLTLPTNSATLTGSSSDPTTYIASYVWTKTSGPSGGDVTNSASKSITITNLVQGVYAYQLKITDDKGVSSTANVKVTVNAAQNSWTASAGPDQTLMLPVNSTTLTGSISDLNTYIASYVWTKISGPSGGLVTNYASKSITITDLVQGVYTYQLKITDDKGVSSTANVKVTVNAAQNSWTAKAGPDQTLTLPVNSTTLTGSSSDPTTYIASYVWTKTSGPSGGAVTNYSLKSITVTDLVQGEYTYQLKITDNNGVSSTANVKVTVNASALFRIGGNLATNEAKIDSTVSVNQISGQSLSLNENRTSNLLKIYPNPVADVATLEVNIPLGSSEVSINITDMNGSTVYKKRISSGDGLVREQINMSSFSSGVYLVTVIFNSSEKQSLKVIKL